MSTDGGTPWGCAILGNKPALGTVRATFDRRLDSAMKMYLSVRPFAVEEAWDAIQGSEVFYPAQARRVIALSFLQLVISWEDLVEACFIRYLMGARSPGGYAPKLRLGSARSVQHAYQLASGNPKYLASAHYMNWGSWSEVAERAHVFFVDGVPFTNLGVLPRDRLADAMRIRNRVVHGSAKAKREFLQIARRHRGMGEGDKLPQGFDVGQLLLDESSKCFGSGTVKACYFEHYCGLFYSLAGHLCPVGDDI